MRSTPGVNVAGGVNARLPHGGIDWRGLTPVLAGVFLVSVALTGAWLGVGALGLHAQPAEYFFYYFNFYYHEPEAWLGVCISLLLATLCLRLVRAEWRLAASWPRASSQRALVWGTAAFVFGMGFLLTLTVQHQHPMSMDEFAAVYQSKIFAAGELSAPIPDLWKPYAAAITPTFIAYRGGEVWHSAYLPVYGAIRAVFVLIGTPLVLNPLLGALAVLLVAAVAKKLWPEESSAPPIAALLLGSSCQVLFTTSSFYTMPAYLALHLAWLWLYLHDRRWSLTLVPVVGALALGVHQLVPHGLFVAPFLLRIVLRRRWGFAAYAALIYGAASLAWISWTEFAHQAPPAGAQAHQLVVTTKHFFKAVPVSYQWLNQSINLSFLFSWQSVLFLVCACLGLAAWRRWPVPLRDLGLGIALTCLLFVFYLGNQGHGWGYRYFYPVLGNAVLVAVFGWLQLCEKVGKERAVVLAGFSLVFALLVQLPFRALQVDSLVRPFAAVQEYFHAQPERMLVLHSRTVWYGEDMIRNEPFLDRSPLVLRMQDLSSDAAEKLPQIGSVRIVQPTEIEALGIPLTPLGRGEHP